MTSSPIPTSGLRALELVRQYRANPSEQLVVVRIVDDQVGLPNAEDAIPFVVLVLLLHFFRQVFGVEIAGCAREFSVLRAAHGPEHYRPAPALRPFFQIIDESSVDLRDFRWVEWSPRELCPQRLDLTLSDPAWACRPDEQRAINVDEDVIGDATTNAPLAG
jgi:hypothetical protein